MKKRATLFLAVLVALIAASPLRAVQPDEVLPDPAQEARARALSRELRCMVCQNQSIDDSDAPLAKDLRLLVRERIKAGDDDRAVLDFLVTRYGEFVLLRPSWHGANVILWTAPFLILIGGGLAIWLRARWRESAAATVPALSAEERRKFDELMSKSDDSITNV
ncbi:cytochrome c-type biogenesis protein [Ancylobacter oerskovii]|uniref:Cytochrome c-type biogenesis protein n=1 Tax=Ancylobacter oerskovii TaxID=459519 RepID=A0ABW4YY41_9HYPH|nr:cytochrome c-type biogenesis protein [Ancylobacter oerskovii]MBS7541987.1 cytochrome c-type biogenesis protein CcmH [Ancylobacter oerskovii]